MPSASKIKNPYSCSNIDSLSNLKLHLKLSIFKRELNVCAGKKSPLKETTPTKPAMTS